MRYTHIVAAAVAAFLLVVSLLAAWGGPVAALQATATPFPTPDPYQGLRVDELAARAYGGGMLEVVQEMERTPAFTRYLISYPSDGLTIYGFMNVPAGEGPFPVIIALHGYVNPAAYYTLDYTTRYADALARAGYLVLHPNLRGYPPSDTGDDRFRIGMAVDVLNLIALVQLYGGRPGALEQADRDAIGLWGHSMGGGIALRVLTASAYVDAAVLYAAMSGDEVENYRKILEWSNGTRGHEELATPPDVLQLISPIFHLDHIEAAVSVHHGTNDDQVPVEWSEDLCTRLEALGKLVECQIYAGQPHTFVGEGDALFVERTIAFFDAHLKDAAAP